MVAEVNDFESNERTQKSTGRIPETVAVEEPVPISVPDVAGEPAAIAKPVTIEKPAAIEGLVTIEEPVAVKGHAAIKELAALEESAIVADLERESIEEPAVHHLAAYQSSSDVSVSSNYNLQNSQNRSASTKYLYYLVTVIY